MLSIRRAGSNTYSQSAAGVCDQLANYFISAEGEVPWQMAHVRSCGPQLN